MNTIWKFKNKTTGKEMDSTDLHFLMYQLRNVKGLNIPKEAEAMLIIKGRVEYRVMDAEGVEQEIVIGEHSPERGIYFRVNS